MADALAVGPSRTADAETPENFADQLEMYDAINTTAPGQLAEGDLAQYFKDSPIDGQLAGGEAALAVAVAAALLAGAGVLLGRCGRSDNRPGTAGRPTCPG